MPTVWLNGRLLDGPIPLDPFDRGLTLGDGLFETIAVFRAKPAYLAPHLGRLEGSAKLLGIEFSRRSLETGVSELLDRQRQQNGILRLTLTRGSGARGLA